jgi:hypothetical protein
MTSSLDISGCRAEFQEDAALPENGMGAAWYVWINAARHGRGTTWYV